MQYHDELEEEEEEHSSNPGIFARIATLLVLTLLVISGIMALNDGQDKKDAAALPVIAESPPPEKVRPEDPGGMDIPHQDASVYENLGKNNKAENSQLMPAAEVPIVQPAPAAPTVAALPDAPAAALPTPSPKTVDAETSAKPETMAEPETADLSKIVQQETAAIPVRLQLGAMSSPEAAKSEWARIKSRYGDVLSGLSPYYSEVNLGEKGSFTRIQTDALPTEDANARCQKLKQSGQACMVVKSAP